MNLGVEYWRTGKVVDKGKGRVSKVSVVLTGLKIKQRVFFNTDNSLKFLSVVPGDGIEPPTQGFSVPCSTY